MVHQVEKPTEVVIIENRLRCRPIEYEMHFLSLVICSTWPRAYKTFFVLNSAEHEISKLDKSNLINFLE